MIPPRYPIPLPPMAIEREGVTFLVHPDSPPKNPFFWSPAMTWETETYAFLANALAPGSRFYDVGAWVGPFTVWASRLGARVVALEPDPAAFALLQDNIRLNPGGDVRPIMGAAGKDLGAVIRLHSTTWGNSQTSGRLRGPDHQSMQAQTFTIDQLAKFYGVPDVIKIDVEGMEAEVLAGAIRTIVDRRPTIVLSTHPGYLYGADWKVIDEVAGIYGRRIGHDNPGPHLLE